MTEHVPPQNGLVRAVDASNYEVRESEDTGATMFGHFARFDEWTEIDSVFEGQFMERIAPGAFTKTMAEDRSSIKVTYNHGKSPYGDLVLGPIQELREDGEGAYYEVPLFPSVPPLLLDGLRAGAYGASFRFRVTREEFITRTDESDHNPQGLPERTILEARVGEFGPVTFPAYASATAGVRSLTDDFLTESQLEEFRALATDLRRKPDEAVEKTGTTPPPAGKAKRRRIRTDYLKERQPSWKL